MTKTVKDIQLLIEQAEVAFYKGYKCHEAGQLPAAIKYYEENLAIKQQLIAKGQEAFRDDKVHTLVILGSALHSSGQLPAAIKRYEAALAIYQSLIAAGKKAFRGSKARTLKDLGNALYSSGQLPAAIERYQEALDIYQQLLAGGQESFRGDQARTLMNLGNPLHDSGQLPAAIKNYQAALAIFQQLLAEGHSQFTGSKAITLMNLGNALYSSGQQAAAIMRYQAALAIYRKLLAEGHSEFRGNQASTLMNLGIALNNSGQRDEAVERYQTALAIYQKLISEGQKKFRAEQARTHMNLGIALDSSGKLPEAIQHHQAALAIFQKLLVEGHSEFRGDAANALMNLGVALEYSGPLAAAITHYQAALAIYQQLIAAGQAEFRANQACTHMNVGTALQDIGDIVESVQHFSEAVVIWHALVHTGQWQHQADYIKSLRIWADSYLVELSTASRMTIEKLQTALETLRELPQWPSDCRDKHLETWRELNRLCHVLAQAVLQHSANPAATQDLSTALQTTLHANLDYAGQLLREADPVWLKAQWPRVQDVLQDLGQLCVQQGGAWPLHWYLRTQSLRSQRMVTMHSSNPELQALYREWLALDTLARRITAAQDAQAAPAQGSDPTGSRSLSLSAAGTSAAPALHAAWQAQHQKVSALRQALAHLLPAATALSPETIAPQIAPQHALVVLMQIHPDHPAQLCALWNSAAGVQHYRQPLDMQAARQGIAHFEAQWVQNHAAEQGRGGQVLRGTRALGAAPQTPQAIHWPTASAHYTQCVQTASQPLWAQLQQQGIHTVHWLVNGDFHTVPWAALLPSLAPNTGLSWRCYPHSAAWWACHTAPRPATGALSAAWLSHDAEEIHASNHPTLPGLLIEQGTAFYWWKKHGAAMAGLNPQQPHWRASATQAAVQALFISAHGVAPPSSGEVARANVAQASILLGHTQGEDRLFTAEQLRQVEAAQNLMLNTCIGGRSQDAISETLGLLAGAFDHSARVVIGAMIPVNDWAATLIGCAFHYHLLQKLPETPNPDWAQCFFELQGLVLQGQWPKGFASALAEAWAPLDKQVSGHARKNLRYTLNQQLISHGLAPKCDIASDWQADWQQLAQAITFPNQQIRDTIGWYAAHGAA